MSQDATDPRPFPVSLPPIFSRHVYELPDLRRDQDHLAIHSVPAEDEDGQSTGQVVLTTTLTSPVLAHVLEELADLVRSGGSGG